MTIRSSFNGQDAIDRAARDLDPKPPNHRTILHRIWWQARLEALDDIRNGRVSLPEAIVVAKKALEEL